MCYLNITSKPLRFFALFFLLLSIFAVANADTPSQQFEFASGLYQQKLYSLAAEKLSDFLKQNPTSPKAALASYELAAALYRVTKPDYAAVAAAYEKALTMPAPTPQIASAARLEVGDAYYQLQKYDQAIKSLTAYLGSTPAPEKDNAAWAQYWIAESDYALKKPDEARAAYAKVVAQYGDNEDVAPYSQYALGVIATDAGDAKTAASAFGAVLTKYPKSDIALNARLQLANALLSDKQYAQAETNYRALIDDPKAVTQKNDALVGLADTYFYAKDFVKAATSYQQALAALPADAKNRATAQLQLGNSFFNSKKYAEALKAYAPLLQSGDANIAAPALYFSAGSQLSLQKFSEATALYTKVVDTYPQHPLAANAALRIGDAQADADNNTGAKAAYQAVLTKYPQSDAASQARKSLAYLTGQAAATQLAAVQTAYDAKDWAKTAQLAQALADKKPSPQVTENALYLWADASRQAGDDATSAQLFRRQITAYPKGTLANDARLGLTWSLLDAKQWKDAAAAARAGLAAAPTDAKSAELRDRMQLALGESLLGDGNAKDAAIAFARVEKSADKDLATQAFYGEALAFETAKQWPAAAEKWAGRAEVSTDAATKADSYLHQGLALQKAKNGAEALAAFDSAVAADPKGTGAAQALYDSAWQAHDLKKTDDEAARWKRLSTDYPNSKFASDALFQQAETLYNAKSYTAAVPLFRDVLNKAPQSDVASQAWYNLGSALYYQKDWSEAAPAFDQAAAAKQNFSLEASFWAGESWREAGKLSEAKTRYQTFLQGLGNAPTANLKALVPRAQLGLGLTLAASNNWMDAANAYTAGLQNAGGDTAAQLHYLLGQALAQQKKWQEASTQFLKVSIGFPDSQWAEKAQWSAGQALEKSGDSAAALTIYKQLAAHQPQDDVVKQAQARVQAMEAKG